MRIITLGLALGLPAGLYSSFSAAALQPISEAPLAVNTAISCQHNKDNSLDCVTSKRFTILHPSGREQLSRIDFTYPAEDRLQVERAEVIQPNGKVIKLGKSQIETRAAPNPDAGVSLTCKPGWPSGTGRRQHRVLPRQEPQRRAAAGAPAALPLTWARRKRARTASASSSSPPAR